MAKSSFIRRALAAPLVPRWTIGAVLVLLWAVDVSTFMLHRCAATTCHSYMVYAQVPGLFVFPYVLWFLLFVPTQSYVFASGVVLMMCAGMYWAARMLLPTRLSVVNLVATLAVWVLLSALGFWALFAGARLLARLQA